MRSRIAVIAANLFIIVMPVLAHHAFNAEFDVNKPIDLKGTISKVEFINPHAWIHVDVKGPDGKIVTWMIEGGSPNTLFRRGVTKDSLAIGTEVVVEGYAAKDGTNKANGANITLPDGRKLFISAPESKPEK
jgi:hypothetical protein